MPARSEARSGQGRDHGPGRPSGRHPYRPPGPAAAARPRAAGAGPGGTVAWIASRPAGPGTRGNSDESTETAAKALEAVGGAARGKAIILLTPVDPPMIMRNPVFCAVPAEAAEPGPLRDAVAAS